MLGLSLAPLALFLYVAMLSTLVGFFFSSLVPWSLKARRAGVPVAFGLGLAPFVLGAFVIFNLIVFSGQQSRNQLVLLLIYLHCFSALFFVFRARMYENIYFKGAFSKIELSLLIFFLIWCVFLMVDSGFLPLTQNDALEYATVGRELYYTNSYATYPILNSISTVSGFYSPWTHPPLYPALIYISYILQGSAEVPGLMRALSPWALLVSASMVYALGCFKNRIVGLVAALLYISTPLIFLGAESGLIDAFPVLGLLLVFSLICSINEISFKSSFIIGLVLGVVLWSHSIAILFPLIILCLLYAKFIKKVPFVFLVKCLLICLLSMIVVAFYPYFKNIINFSSLVSDNPVVFSLESLDWRSYFSIARGISDFSDKVQYGLLKGFFSLEAYATVFWLFLITGIWALLLFYKQKARLSHVLYSVKNALFLKYRLSVFSLSTLLLLCFFCGVALSIILDVDLLIKNERYFLIIIPFVCLSVGFYFNFIFKYYNSTSIKQVSLAAVSLLLALQLILFSLYRLYTFNGFDFNEPEAGIYKRAEYQAVRFLEKKTELTSLVLSLKPADMYYSKRKMISYLDPRLVAFYHATTLEKAYEELLRLGVNYIHLPSYSLPPVYNSQLQSLLSDPSYTELLFSRSGNQIYKLNNAVNHRLDWRFYFDLSSENSVWNKVYKWTIGGRKELFSVSSKQIVDNGRVIVLSNKKSFFSREKSVVATTTGGRGGKGIPLEKDREYLLRVELSGIGLVTFSIEQSQDLHKSTRKIDFIPKYLPMGDMILTLAKKRFVFSRRFKSLEQDSLLRVMIAKKGNGVVNFKHASLSVLEQR